MQKDVKLGITKDKLIDAAFTLMEEAEDPFKVTSRQIAERAGTKASMINYCFGSRENLLYQTFQKQYMSFLKEDESTIMMGRREPMYGSALMVL